MHESVFSVTNILYIFLGTNKINKWSVFGSDYNVHELKSAENREMSRSSAFIDIFDTLINKIIALNNVYDIDNNIIIY